MKTNIHMEQCGAGWKVLVDIEDVTEGEAFNTAKRLIENAAEFTMALPGWDVNRAGGAEASSPEDSKWRRAYFAKQKWAAGRTR